MNTELNADTAPAQSVRHTPGPLKVLEPYTDRNVFPIGRSIGNGAFAIVAEVNSQGGTPEQARALAEFVVRACNSHAELLEACKILSGRVDKIDWAFVEAAIAKAERGQQ